MESRVYMYMWGEFGEVHTCYIFEQLFCVINGVGDEIKIGS